MFVKYGLVAIALAVMPVQACDVCGSAGAANQFGILSGSNMSFVGLRYQYRLFNSKHPVLFENETPLTSANHFSLVEIWGRWALSNRWHVYGFIPYSSYHDEDYRFNGLGDVSVFSNYAIVNQQDTIGSAIVKRKFLLGVGVKFPTGQSTSPILGAGLPNMQPGTGSWDGSFGLQYHWKKSDWGLNIESTYRLNGNNFYRFKFGDRWSNSVTGFKTITLNKPENSIVPQIGGQHVWAQVDYINSSKGEVNEYSGGQFLHATLGVDLILNKVVFNINYQLPVWQDYAQGNINNRMRLTAGVKFLML